LNLVCPELLLLINPDDQRTFGPCECCGSMTQRVWGYVNQGDATIAAYFVEWTPGHVQNAANFDIIIGAWGPATVPEDRRAVALDFRRFDTGPAFTVIDATIRPVGKSSLVSEALKREQVIGDPIAKTVFAICDTVLTQDPRLTHLHNALSETTDELSGS
jgi:hypothetical protein